MVLLELDFLERCAAELIVSGKTKGSRVEMMLVYDMLKRFAFTPLEVETYGISTEGDYAEKNFSVGFELSDQQLQIIDNCIDELGDDIHIQMVPFIAKIDTLKNK